MAKKQKSLSDPRDALIHAALRLASRNEWHVAGMAAIAAEADLPIGKALRHFSTKSQILAAYTQRIDEIILDGNSTPQDGETSRDRLFDVIMQRFDALEANKAGIRNIIENLPRDPVGAICHSLRMRKSMRLMLEVTGIDTSGCSGQLRIKGIGAVYLNALRVWLKDDSADLGSTMAALDRGLAQAEKAARMLWGRSPSAEFSED